MTGCIDYYTRRSLEDSSMWDWVRVDRDQKAVPRGMTPNKYLRSLEECVNKQYYYYFKYQINGTLTCEFGFEN